MLALSTLAAVVSILGSPLAASASPVTQSLDKRAFTWGGMSFSGTPSAQKPYYGASGVAWVDTNTPGAWVGKVAKPVSDLWNALPFWDGGDKSQCTIWTMFSPVCTAAGNKPGSIPEGSNPPKTSTGAAVCAYAYQTQYQNYTTVADSGAYHGQVVGAAAQDPSYLTYHLSDTVEGCLKACDNINKCVFVNSYYDVSPAFTNEPKHAPGVLTCALFSTCVSSSKNNNWGGQGEIGSLTSVESSNGYCKSGACASIKFII